MRKKFNKFTAIMLIIVMIHSMAPLTAGADYTAVYNNETIAADGLLTVGANETTTTLTIRAASTLAGFTNISGTAIVTVSVERPILASGDDAGPNVSWTLYEDGELVISGTGNMYNWDSWSNNLPPWHAHGPNIRTVTISVGVTTIGRQAFALCTSLVSVDMPSVTTIGEAAFYDCTSLVNVDMPSVTTIGERAFNVCRSLVSVDMPNVTTIGGGAFANCSSLVSVDMPSVTSIAGSAFAWCTSLVSVDMPSVTTIGGRAFNDCSSLECIM